MLEKLKFQIAEENDEDIDEGMKEYINKQNELFTDKVYSYVIPKERKSTFWRNLTNLGLARKPCFQKLITKQNI